MIFMRAVLLYYPSMNDAAELMLQTGSTTRELLVVLVPAGESIFGSLLAFLVLGLIIVVVARSFQSAL